MPELAPTPASRCAIYARFSTDRQSETSAEDQVRDCRRYAEARGWTVVEVFTDAAISGADNRRPGMTALLAAVAQGAFDTVLAEDQDRLARDQEDIARIFKRVSFAGARLVTLAAGELNELHIGLKGTMDALELKKIAEKVRRGQRGAVARGRIPGGLAYGYRLVRRLDARGELEKGLREIDPDQARIVVRIFAEYAAGRSVKAICRDLNCEGVPSPRGGEWRVSAILGHKDRATGILHNPLYRGRFVYNRTRWLRDPETRNRRPRTNAGDAHETAELPELRIVDEDLWNRVRAAESRRTALPLRQRTRPKHLLSGLVSCGVCGGRVSIVTTNRLGCSGRFNGGLCGNGRTIGVGIVQRRVLAGLEEQLLSAEAVALLVREYHAERARRRADEGRERKAREKRLREAETAVERLVAAIADGGREFADIRAMLAARTAERDRMRAELAEEQAAPVIALHPRIADVYRERVRALVNGLESGAITADSAAGRIRALISGVVVTPREDRGCDIEVVGSLEAALALATGRRSKRGSEYTAEVVAGVRSRHGSIGRSISV